jgi:hypothetical protein
VSVRALPNDQAIWQIAMMSPRLPNVNAADIPTHGSCPCVWPGWEDRIIVVGRHDVEEVGRSKIVRGCDMLRHCGTSMRGGWWGWIIGTNILRLGSSYMSVSQHH